MPYCRTDIHLNTHCRLIVGKSSSQQDGIRDSGTGSSDVGSHESTLEESSSCLLSVSSCVCLLPTIKPTIILSTVMKFIARISTAHAATHKKVTGCNKFSENFHLYLTDQHARTHARCHARRDKGTQTTIQHTHSLA